jgi:hypothetical protein
MLERPPDDRDDPEERADDEDHHPTARPRKQIAPVRPSHSGHHEYGVKKP